MKKIKKTAPAANRNGFHIDFLFPDALGRYSLNSSKLYHPQSVLTRRNFYTIF